MKAVQTLARNEQVKHAEEIVSLKALVKQTVSSLLKEQTADIAKLQAEFKTVLGKYKADLKNALASSQDLVKKERQANDKVKQIETKLSQNEETTERAARDLQHMKEEVKRVKSQDAAKSSKLRDLEEQIKLAKTDV